jgi:hypothetical protein
MRRLLLGLVIALGVSAIASEARAQTNLSDPFFAYYSFYLPRQQAQALQPGPEATINAVTAYRQQFAATGRNGMFDPNGAGSDPFGSGDDSGFDTGKGRRRSSPSASGRFGVHGGNLKGLGPQGYFNASLSKYYRDLRTGRGKNANVAVMRASRGGGLAGGGYGGMGGGIPGPR